MCSMNRVTNGSENEKARVYETLLSSPGMQEKCRVNLALSRQGILLFCRLIELGFSADQDLYSDAILMGLPMACREELAALKEELLKKGALEQFYQKLKEI
jgi:hypothetical protein